MPYRVVYSPVFKITLKRLHYFLSKKYSHKLASETKQNIRVLIEGKLLSDPFIGPVCDRLLDLGVGGYQQLSIDKHNLVIYRVDKSKMKIIILLVLDSRQSIEKLLNDVNLMI